MELKTVKQDEKTLIVEVVGETRGFANLISEELWEDKSISEAAQIKGHPYLDQPKIFVKTDRGSPATALEKATDRILDQVKEFREEFKKALKK